MVLASWLIGITTWFLGAAVSFATWGWIGLLIGLFLLGVGVVPVGIAAAIISLGNYELAISLVILAVVTFALRIGGAALLENVAAQPASDE